MVFAAVAAHAKEKMSNREDEQPNDEQVPDIDAEDIEECNKLRAFAISPLEKRDTALGDTVMTEYVENTKTNSGSGSSPKKQSAVSSHNSIGNIEAEQFEVMSPVKAQEWSQVGENARSCIIEEGEEEVKQSDLADLRRKQEQELLKPVSHHL